MTDRMTDQATPLTQESVDLLADVYGTQMSLTVYPSRLRAIEAAAARRAIEGSGVVSVERLLDAWEALEHPSIDAAIAAALTDQERGS